MQITVNGKPREVQVRCSLLQLLEQHEINPVLVAVEYNGDIVHQDHFGEIDLKAGDNVEIVHMVGGG